MGFYISVQVLGNYLIYECEYLLSGGGEVEYEGFVISSYWHPDLESWAVVVVAIPW